MLELLPNKWDQVLRPPLLLTSMLSPRVRVHRPRDPGFDELNPEATVLSIDGISAYDQISRASVMDGLFSLCGGEAVPFVRLFYGSPSTYMWEDAEGVEHLIPQGEGCCAFLQTRCVCPQTPGINYATPEAQHLRVNSRRQRHPPSPRALTGVSARGLQKINSRKKFDH